MIKPIIGDKNKLNAKLQPKPIFLFLPNCPTNAARPTATNKMNTCSIKNNLKVMEVNKINSLIEKFKTHIEYCLEKSETFEDDNILSTLYADEAKNYKKVVIELHYLINDVEENLNLSDDLDEDLYDMVISKK